MKVKFATYNIQYGVGQDGCYDLKRIAEQIQGQDIVCLQEATTNWAACNHDNQPDILARTLNLYVAYAPAFEIDESYRDTNGVITNVRRGFGNMVLSRWPIIYSRPHSLARPPTEVPTEFYPNVDFPRTALEVVIDIDDTPVRVFSLHLSHLSGAQQQVQVEMLKILAFSLREEAPLWENDTRISQWSQNRSAPPVPRSTLLFGDFNFEADSEYYSAMLTAPSGQHSSLIDGWSEGGGSVENNATCVENDGRLSRLDYLFVSEDLRGKIHSANVRQDTIASDHFPLYFTVDVL